MLAKDLGYLNLEAFNSLEARSDETARTLTGLIAAIRTGR